MGNGELIEMLSKNLKKEGSAGYFLRIDCGKAEDSLKTTPCSECALNALAIDEPLEYATHWYADEFALLLREICRYGWMRKIL